MCISVGETSIKLRLIQQRHIIFLGCELKKDKKKPKKKKPEACICSHF